MGRRGTGRFVAGVVITVVGASWLFKKAGVNVPGFNG
jgi:hypothetical protein